MPPQTLQEMTCTECTSQNECTVLPCKQNSGSSEENLTTYDDILFQLCDLFSTFQMPKKCVFNFSPRLYVKKCIVCAPHYEFSERDTQQKHSLLLAFRKPVEVANNEKARHVVMWRIFK